MNVFVVAGVYFGTCVSKLTWAVMEGKMFVLALREYPTFALYMCQLV